MAHSDDIDDLKVGTKQMEETNPTEGKYLTWAAASWLAAEFILQPQGIRREMGSLSCVDFVEFSSEIVLSCCEKCPFQKVACLWDCRQSQSVITQVKMELSQARLKAAPCFRAPLGKRWRCVKKSYLFGISLTQYAKWGLLLIELKTLCLSVTTYPQWVTVHAQNAWEVTCQLFMGNNLRLIAAHYRLTIWRDCLRMHTIQSSKVERKEIEVSRGSLVLFSTDKIRSKS